MQIDPQRQQAAVASQQADRAAREANVDFARQQLQRAQDCSAPARSSRQELEAGGDERYRPPKRACSRSARRCNRSRCSCATTRSRAPTAGIVGDVPVRVGNQVSPQTLLTTIDQNDSLEVYVQVPIERAPRPQDRPADRDPRAVTAQTLATTTASFISPRVDEQTQSVLVKGLVRNADRRAARRRSSCARGSPGRTARGWWFRSTAVVRINGQHFAFVAEDAKDLMASKLVAKQRADQGRSDRRRQLRRARRASRRATGWSSRAPRSWPTARRSRRRRPSPSRRVATPYATIVRSRSVCRHLHPSADPGERLLAGHHPRRRDRDSDAADRAVPAAGAAAGAGHRVLQRRRARRPSSRR